MLPIFAKGQRGIEATETEGIAQRVIHSAAHGLTGAVIQIALFIGVMQVHRWRDQIVEAGQRGDDAFRGASGRDQVTEL